jgi:hypothetical protein
MPWNYTLDAVATRRHDHQAFWLKDVLATMNMRIVNLYALTGEKPTWNKRLISREGYYESPTRI